MMSETHSKLSLDKQVSLNTLIAIASCFAGGFFFLERLEDKIVDRIMVVLEQKEQIAHETHKGLDQRIVANKDNIDRIRTTVEQHTEQIALLRGKTAARNGTQKDLDASTDIGGR